MRRPDYSQADDAELLVLTASDPEAFGVFYERFEAQILGFLWRATGRADIAADLTAEVFAAALESTAAFREESGSARGWLFGIAQGPAARRQSVGPDGAYLIVTPGTTHRYSGAAGSSERAGLYVSDEVPVYSPITAIHYRGGATCHLWSGSFS